MTLSDIELLGPEVEGWLDPGEHLISWTAGTPGSNSLVVVVALTSKFLRLGSMDGGRNIAKHDIQEISWSGLWARLNVRVESADEKLVFTISGREWKDRAEELASAWQALSSTE